MQPDQTPEESENPVTQAPGPIAEVELPRVEQAVISNPRNPRRNLYTGLAILVLLAGMATGYALFKP